MEKHAARVAARHNPYNRPLPCPLLSHELLITAVELVCYFCTAIGVVFAFLFAATA